MGISRVLNTLLIALDYAAEAVRTTDYSKYPQIGKRRLDEIVEAQTWVRAQKLSCYRKATA